MKNIEADTGMRDSGKPEVSQRVVRPKATPII